MCVIINLHVILFLKNLVNSSISYCTNNLCTLNMNMNSFSFFFRKDLAFNLFSQFCIEVIKILQMDDKPI